MTIGHDTHTTPPPPETTEEQALDVQAYLRVFYRRRHILIAVFAVMVTLGLVAMAMTKRQYEATTRLLIASSKAGSSDGDIPLLTDLKALTENRSVDTQVEVISSNDLLDDAFAALDDAVRKRGFPDRVHLPDVVKVEAKANTDTIDITVHAYTPQAAAAFANQIADTYFVRDLAQSNQATRQVRKYVEENMARVRAEMTRANAALASYKTRTHLFAPDTQLAKFAEGLATLQLDLATARTSLAATRQAQNVLRKQLNDVPAEIIADTNVTKNPRFAAIVSKIDALHGERATLLQEYRADADEVRALDGRIAEEEHRLRAVAETIVAAQTRAHNPVQDAVLGKYLDNVAAQAASAAHIRQASAELRERAQVADALPERQRALTDLIQQASLQRATYEMLTQKYHALVLSEQGTLPNGRVIDHARVPRVPVKPRPLRTGVGILLLAMLAATGTALLLERMDDRVHDQETAETITGAGTMAMVPNMKGETAPLLITRVGPHSPLLESFRILRHNIAFAGIERARRILAVSSSGPGEGKSTTCANLALAMAMDGKRVIIVDCDLRRPSMHNILGVSRERGVTNVLTGACTLDEAILSGGVPGLDVLPTGPLPPNPTEVLNAAPTRKLFADLVERYDIVLVDCPPSAGLSDVQVISTLADGLLLVVTMDQTLRERLRIAVRALALAGAPLIGLVINRLDLHHQGYGYYYYYAEAEDGTNERRRRKRQ
jgi:capsular exopolysaccharide synthesis family protein